MDPRDDDSDDERELLDTASVSQESSTVPPIFSSDAKSKLCGNCFLSESTTAAEVICLSIIVAFILSLFSAPIFIHFFLELDNPIASTLQNDTFIAENCSNTTWGRVSNICTATEYNSNVCSNELKEWQLCAVGPQSSVLVTSSHLNNQTNASIILNLISNDPDISSDCKSDVIPFVCRYMFPLCDGNSSQLPGDQLLPSLEECKRISENTCAEEWSEVKSSGYGYILPDCNKLPRNSQDLPTVSPPPFTCAEGFTSNNRSCFPSCQHWNQAGVAWGTALRVILILALLMVVISSITLFVVSFIRYKNMLKYPSIYLVFMTFGFFVVAIVSIGGQVDQSGLFCRDDNIITTFMNSPTLFCVLNGATFQYFVLSSTLWWFFHVCSIFFKMTFPLTAQKNKGKQLTVHILLTIFGCIAPIPGVVFAIVDENLSYIVSNFPPILCTSRSKELWFYSTMLPIDILFGVGVSLLIIILWLLHKYQAILKAEPNGSKLSLSTPEKKILVVFFFYVIFGIAVLAYFGVITDKYDPIEDVLQAYFTCEEDGFVPGKCSLQQYAVRTFSLPYAIALILILLGLVPCVNLVFVVNWKYLKEKLVAWKEQIDMYRTMSVNDGDQRSTQHVDIRYRAM